MWTRWPTTSAVPRIQNENPERRAGPWTGRTKGPLYYFSHGELEQRLGANCHASQTTGARHRWPQSLFTSFNDMEAIDRSLFAPPSSLLQMRSGKANAGRAVSGAWEVRFSNPAASTCEAAKRGASKRVAFRTLLPRLLLGRRVLHTGSPHGYHGLDMPEVGCHVDVRDASRAPTSSSMLPKRHAADTAAADTEAVVLQLLVDGAAFTRALELERKAAAAAAAPATERSAGTTVEEVAAIEGEDEPACRVVTAEATFALWGRLDRLSHSEACCIWVHGAADACATVVLVLAVLHACYFAVTAQQAYEIVAERSDVRDRREWPARLPFPQRLFGHLDALQRANSAARPWLLHFPRVHSAASGAAVRTDDASSAAVLTDDASGAVVLADDVSCPGVRASEVAYDARGLTGNASSGGGLEAQGEASSSNSTTSGVYCTLAPLPSTFQENSTT